MDNVQIICVGGVPAWAEQSSAQVYVFDDLEDAWEEWRLGAEFYEVSILVVGKKIVRIRKRGYYGTLIKSVN